MIDWAVIRPAFVAWIVAGTGLDSKLVFFENDKRPFHQKRFLVVRVTRTGNTPAFTDTVEQVTDGGDGFYQKISGSRSITATLEVWSNEQSATGIAENTLEKLRTLSNTDRVRATLDNSRVTLASFGDAIQADVEIDQRLWSVWSAELDFNHTFEYSDQTETNASIIEAVALSAEIPEGSDPQTFTVDTREP